MKNTHSFHPSEQQVHWQTYFHSGRKQRLFFVSGAPQRSNHLELAKHQHWMSIQAGRFAMVAVVSREVGASQEVVAWPASAGLPANSIASRTLRDSKGWRGRGGSEAEAGLLVLGKERLRMGEEADEVALPGLRQDYWEGLDGWARLGVLLMLVCQEPRKKIQGCQRGDWQ
jgi:hypothetical protein